MNNLNIPDDKLAMLLSMAGKKMGKDPARLQEELKSGKLNDAIQGLDDGTKKQIGALLQNPGALQQLLKSDQLQSLLNGLQKK